MALPVREKLRAELRAEYVAPEAVSAEATPVLERIREEFGAGVLAVLQERNTGDYLVTVKSYEAVYDASVEVWAARWLSPAHHVLRIADGDGGTRPCHVYLMELDALERQASGYAWDLAVLGMLVRGCEVVFADTAVIEERLTDCRLGALRFVGRLALDQQPSVFASGDFVRSALAISTGHSELEPTRYARDLYERDTDAYDRALLPVLDWLTTRSSDAYQRDDGYWMWSDDGRRRFQRSAYVWVFLKIAAIRARLRSPGWATALAEWVEKAAVPRSSRQG